MNQSEETRLLRARVEELEQRMEHLRVSRRVLMNLLEKVEYEKTTLVCQLEKENLRLRRDNKRFARWVFLKNKEMVILQETMGSDCAQKVASK